MKVRIPFPISFDYKNFLKNLTHHPGIYQMFNAKGEILYIGKARNLKKRLSSYFRFKSLTDKTAALIRQIEQIQVIMTRTENEALLLESTLIKKHKPQYNILLREDKGHAYLVLDENQDFPRLDFYRGRKTAKLRYFGPYINAYAARKTLHLLKKIFGIRTCDNIFFQYRHRPCLEYQIGRCSGPCVGYIDQENYRELIKQAILFLEGKDETVIEHLIKKMEEASDHLNFEQAIKLRDQISLLRQTQQQQNVISAQSIDCDAISILEKQGKVVVQVLSIFQGQLLQSEAYFPKAPAGSALEEILEAFIIQYYLSAENLIPPKILISHALSNSTWIASVLAEQAKHKVQLVAKPKGERAHWLAMAKENAEQSLIQYLGKHSLLAQRFLSLKNVLHKESNIKRLECFDISHTQGEATVASCVVFDEQGPAKKDYRRFNIKDLPAGDDYAAIRQAVQRRYTRLKQESSSLPDVLIIDGGKGQLAQAESVLKELDLAEIIILAIAKGSTRKPGLETVFISGRSEPLALDSDSEALHLIQHLRDEAHRFALASHQKRRAKTRRTSVLESIPGIGTHKSRLLLQRFGGLQELKRASIEALAKLPGIDKALAQRIYQTLQQL